MEIEELPKENKKVSSFQKNIGLLFMFLSTSFLASLGIIAKIIKIRTELKNESFKILFWRAVTGFFSSFFQILGIFLMPLSIASVIYFTQPIFAAWFAVILLKEKLTFIGIISLLSSSVGMVFLVQPNLILGESFSKSNQQNDKQYPYYYFGALFSALGAISSALAYITMRKLAPFKLHMAFNAYYFGIYSTPISFFLMAVFDQNIADSMTLEGLILLTIMGISGYLAQTLLGLALQNQPVGRASVMNYLQVVFAFVVDILAFDSHIVWTDIVGSVLIIGFTLANSIIKCL
ncbi:membrane protein [Stylonychia lemnae]|uniref:Membrane protein n=1 Tax=Stylonychia lemnae TaxID=5949 RepID=A0A078AAN5_STYLE|nr:membrane protein [Stylonychia lemnae]|eukprot:CDW77858.1 membrane protein [Stylonychia lemnae]